MAETKNKNAIAIADTVKELVAQGLDDEKLKHLVEEYVEVSRIKVRIAKEIVEHHRENKRTTEFLDELEKDIALAEKELDGIDA
jgi:hypothetical protein